MTPTDRLDALDAALVTAGDAAAAALTLVLSAIGLALVPLTLPAAWLGERRRRS